MVWYLIRHRDNFAFTFVLRLSYGSLAAHNIEVPAARSCHPVMVLLCYCPAPVPCQTCSLYLPCHGHEWDWNCV